MKTQQIWKSQTNFEKEENVGGLTLRDFRSYYKVPGIENNVAYTWTNKSIEQNICFGNRPTYIWTTDFQ